MLRAMPHSDDDVYHYHLFPAISSLFSYPVPLNPVFFSYLHHILLPFQPFINLVNYLFPLVFGFDSCLEKFALSR